MASARLYKPHNMVSTFTIVIALYLTIITLQIPQSSAKSDAFKADIKDTDTKPVQQLETNVAPSLFSGHHKDGVLASQKLPKESEKEVPITQLRPKSTAAVIAGSIIAVLIIIGSLTFLLYHFIIKKKRKSPDGNADSEARQSLMAPEAHKNYDMEEKEAPNGVDRESKEVNFAEMGLQEKYGMVDEDAKSVTSSHEPLLQARQSNYNATEAQDDQAQESDKKRKSSSAKFGK